MIVGKYSSNIKVCKEQIPFLRLISPPQWKATFKLDLYMFRTSLGTYMCLGCFFKHMVTLFILY